MFETVDNFEELYNGTCSKNLFKNTSITCNSWVSDTKESTIQNEVSMKAHYITTFQISN